MVANIKPSNVSLEQVKDSSCLRSVITIDNKCLVDVTETIVLGKQPFQTGRNLFTNNRINIPTKRSFLRRLCGCKYGCESWALGKMEIDKRHAAEMRIWKRAMKTNRADRITKEQKEEFCQ